MRVSWRLVSSTPILDGGVLWVLTKGGHSGVQLAMGCDGRTAGYAGEGAVLGGVGGGVVGGEEVCECGDV